MDDMINKKQNRKVTVFAIILSIISIGLLVGGFVLVSSDKVVMLQSLSNLANKVEKAFEDDELSNKLSKFKDIGVKANIELVSNNINGKVNIDYLENKNDKKSKMDLDLFVNNQELVNLETVFADDKVYLYADDITPKYYYTAFEYVNVLSSFNNKDYNKLFNLVKDAVTDSINDEKIKKEKVKIDYNGKSKNVNKLSYAITNEDIKNMLVKFTKSLKKEKKLLEKFAELANVSYEEIITSLDSMTSTLVFEEVETVLYYNVYYYGFNKIVRYELADVNNNPVIEYKVEDKEKISLYSEKEEVLKLEISKNKDKFNFTGLIKNIEDGAEVSFSGNVSQNDFIIIVDAEGLSIKLVVNSNQESKGNNYIYKNSFVLSAISQDQEVELGKLNVDLEYYFDEKVKVDLSNSGDISNISQDDLSVLQQNLMNHPLYNFIVGYTENMNVGL